MNNYWCCKNAGGENTGFYLGLARARDYVDASANSINVIDTPQDSSPAPAPGITPHSTATVTPARFGALTGAPLPARRETESATAGLGDVAHAGRTAPTLLVFGAAAAG